MYSDGTPIKVVNLQPEQTVKTQIAMGGAEQILIRYVDPMMNLIHQR
jgi:hypothetical protein